MYTCITWYDYGGRSLLTNITSALIWLILPSPLWLSLLMLRSLFCVTATNLTVTPISLSLLACISVFACWLKPFGPYRNKEAPLTITWKGTQKMTNHSNTKTLTGTRRHLQLLQGKEHKNPRPTTQGPSVRDRKIRKIKWNASLNGAHFGGWWEMLAHYFISLYPK